MNTSTVVGVPPVSLPYIFTVPADDFRSLPIAGLGGQKVGDCFVKVTDLPDELEHFMEVNPRVPRRNQKNVLTGPVIKGIMETLTENPEDMAIKNQGIYLLAEDVTHTKVAGGAGKLTIKLMDPSRHGIVNGGHTYAAIREAIENADDQELDTISRAYVRLHILQGIPDSKVAEIAEGLNRSKQVDDPSLAHLRGDFDRIKETMHGRPGEKAISYNQGEEGEVYITEILVFLELFNGERFSRRKHPHYLYSRTKSALEFFESDSKAVPSPVDMLISRLPEILVLSDMIRQQTPEAANRIGFQFGRMKEDKKKKIRVGSAPHKKNVPLFFLDQKMSHRVPKGWLYPMLAAFRANVDWDLQKGKFEWKVPLAKLLPKVIDDLVGICVTEHRDNNQAPDKVGKRESNYVQCYDKIQLYLLESGLEKQG
jgi:hypothetical protein